MQSLVSGLFASRILFAAADGTAQSGMSPPEPVKAKGGGVVTVIKLGDIEPPRAAPPCEPGSCLFAGQSVTVTVSDSVISSSIHLLSYDKYYNDPRFPKWNIDDVLPAPRSLLSYGGKKYMVAGHDGGRLGTNQGQEHE